MPEICLIHPNTFFRIRCLSFAVRWWLLNMCSFTCSHSSIGAIACVVSHAPDDGWRWWQGAKLVQCMRSLQSTLW
jgi:hypothetical protein